MPRARPYPTFLDYASRDLLQGGGEFITNYRAYHTYVVSYEDGATGEASPCVFLPRCHNQGETVIAVDPSRRPDEALENAPKSEAGGNQRIGMRVEAPNNQHWGLTEGWPICTVLVYPDGVPRFSQRLDSRSGSVPGLSVPGSPVRDGCYRGKRGRGSG